MLLKRSTLILLLAALNLMGLFRVAYGIPASEISALHDLYDLCVTPPSWDFTDNLCGQSGITCGAENTVTELSVTASAGLHHIPSSIGKLRDLTSLTLGPLNGPVPLDLGSLKRLNTLYLLGTRFIPILAGAGEFPQAVLLRLTRMGKFKLVWSNVTAIDMSTLVKTVYNTYKPSRAGLVNYDRNIELTDNLNLEVVIPSNIVDLPVPAPNSTNTLQILVNDNGRPFSLPSISVSPLVVTPYTTLDLRDNQLTGPVKPWVTVFANVFLSGNKLTSLWPMNNTGTERAYIDLSNNLLRGTIPTTFYPPLNSVLKLSTNSLVGSVPQGVLRLTGGIGVNANWLSGALSSVGINITQTAVSGDPWARNGRVFNIVQRSGARFCPLADFTTIKDSSEIGGSDFNTNQINSSCTQCFDSAYVDGSSLCSGNGNCSSTNTALNCTCDAGAAGAYCQIVDPCYFNSTLCGKHGVCHEVVLQTESYTTAYYQSDYECSCKTNQYIGDNCEISAFKYTPSQYIGMTVGIIGAIALTTVVIIVTATSFWG